MFGAGTGGGVARDIEHRKYRSKIYLLNAWSHSCVDRSQNMKWWSYGGIHINPDICKIHLQTFVVFLQSQGPASSVVALFLEEPPQAEHLG